MFNTVEGKYYVSVLEPEHIRAAVLEWLTTGAFGISDPSSVRFRSFRMKYIPFCQLACVYEAPWTADVGRVDQGTYSMAMNQYRMAESHYQSLSEQVQRYAERPTRPDERDFVRWSERSGTLSGRWQSGTMLAMNSPDHGLDNSTADWISTLRAKLNIPEHAVYYSTFESWSKYAGETRYEYLEPEEDGLISNCMTPVNKTISKEVRSLLPAKYVRNVSTYASYEFEVVNPVIFPVYLVDYEVGGKRSGKCVVDGVTATVVIGNKIRDIKGVVARFLSPIRAIVGRGSKPPKLITQDASASQLCPEDENVVEKVLSVENVAADVAERWAAASAEADMRPTRIDVVHFVKNNFDLDINLPKNPKSTVTPEELQRIWTRVASLILETHGTSVRDACDQTNATEMDAVGSD